MLEITQFKVIQTDYQPQVRIESKIQSPSAKNIEPFLKDSNDAVAKAGAAMYAEYEALNQNKQRQVNDDSIVNYAY